jgi:hypothetical protein
MTERERKNIVMQHLRRQFEAKYMQVKLNMEKELRQKQDSHKSEKQLSHYFSRPL